MCPPAITPFGPSQHRGNRRLRSRLSQAIFTHTHRHVRPRPIKSPQSTTLFQRPCLVLPDPVAAIQRAPFFFFPCSCFFLTYQTLCFKPWPCDSRSFFIIRYILTHPRFSLCLCVCVCVAKRTGTPLPAIAIVAAAAASEN